MPQRLTGRSRVLLHLRKCLAPLALGLVLIAACATDVERASVVSHRGATPTTFGASRPRSTTTVPVLRVVKEVHEVLEVLYPTTTTTQPAPTTAPRALVQYPASFQPCDGEYPPCYRVASESGGDYNAYNPSGCNGSGCYGKWQFSGEWACRLGLPCDLASATPAQQDEAARLLWNHGAGCSNWSAC